MNYSDRVSLKIMEFEYLVQLIKYEFIASSRFRFVEKIR